MSNKEEKDVLDKHNFGLTIEEVIERQKYGKNELPKAKKDSVFKIFISQFFDSIIFIMIVAAIVSIAINEVVDAVVIALIIVLDAILGTIQEWKAGKNTEALENMIKVVTKVIRDNKEIIINSSELVVDDIILLQSGDRVPADAVILSCNNFTVDESALTGESIPNQKHPKHGEKVNKSNIVFAGTNVMTGRATCIVTSIGVNTEIGKIATEVSKQDKTKTPLTIRVDKFSKQISIFIIIVSILLTALLFFKGENFTSIILSVVALTVSAMPEGLPLALTLALTIGSNRMAKRNIIVKKLKAVESLGSCTVIASDKTGTLTVNEQTAKKIILPNGEEFNVTGTGYNDEGEVIGNGNISKVLEIAKFGLLNNESKLEFSKNEWTSHGDSIDIAFIALGKKLKVDISNTLILGRIPYESENKYSALFYKENDELYCTVKGSLETVFEFCDYMYDGERIIKLDREKIIKQNEMLAKDGYRVIALANNKFDKFNKKDFYDKNDIPKLVFCGLVAFIDPIRKEAIPAIKKCQRAGIDIIMITGDHPLTAYSIAKELELANSYELVTTGEELENYLVQGKEEFDKFIKTKKIFTRVTPTHKFEIVESLKRRGEFVAVTGDGVNDAPALKAANIGVAMGSGTDVAKETSTMIITDDNFLSIVSGIEEGRNAYSNIRKVIYMLISCGLAEVLFFIISILFNMPMPLVAIQLLWLNVVTDGLQDLALSFERLETGIMEAKPRDPKESLFDSLLKQEIILSGLSIGIIVFIFWYILVNVVKMDVSLARGYIMTLMVFMQNIHVLNCRSETESTFKISLRSNPFIIFSIVSAIILQIIVMEVPFISNAFQVESIPLSQVFILFIGSLPILVIMEIFKAIRRKKVNRS